MSTPLAATHRIEFPIVVDGFTHHVRQYVKVTPGAGPSGFDAVLRDGTLGVDVTDCADALYNIYKAHFQASVTTFGQPELQVFSSGAWLPVATLPTTTAPTGTTAYVKASQWTMSMRDTDFHRIRSILLEADFFAGSKQIPPGAPGFDTIIAWYNGPIALVHTNGWNWIVGRSNLYIGAVISVVTDLNDKIRRRRGIA